MRHFLTLFFLQSVSVVFAQLKIDTSYSSNYLVDEILTGNGVRTGNVILKGYRDAIGYFEVDSAVIGFNRGILISTGSVFNAAGENDTPGKSGVLAGSKTATQRLSRQGDRDLNKICRGRTKDVTILEFDFIPFHNKVCFNYCFSSEEYKDYVGSAFNDVFAFFVSGPSFKRRNVALIPGTTIPVTINNVNHKKHNDYFVNNDHFINFGLSKSDGNNPKVTFFQFLRLLFTKNAALGNGYISSKVERKKLNQYLVNNFQYDGFTTTLSAEFYVIPYRTYHIKIAIGDVGDNLFDSGVFLQAGSFSGIRDTRQPGFVEYISPEIDTNTLTFDKPLPVNATQEAEREEIPEKFELITLYFDTDKSEISAEDQLFLDDFADYLKKHPAEKFFLFGYTDNRGSNARNQELSEERAKKVMAYLIAQGVDASQLEYRGHSSEDPAGDNQTSEGRARNRRVEIVPADDSEE